MSSKKKILLVSNGFYPEISPRSFRATELAKEFVRQGHEITVISKFRDFDYSDFLKEHPLQFKMWDKPRFPVVPAFHGKLGRLATRILARQLQLFFEYPGIEEIFKVKKALSQETNYDLMISFAVPYPVHWGTAWAQSEKNRIAEIWVADCGDPYMGDVLDTFRKPFYFKYFEKWFMQKTDFITIPIDEAKRAYYKEFHHKIKIIPQGFRFDLCEIKVKEVNNAIPTFAYAGSLAPSVRDPRAFLDYLASKPEDFKFVVYTQQKEIFKDHIEILNKKLELRNYITHKQLLLELSEMDFLVNFDNNTEIQLPSKLIDYALTGRPVLNIKNNLKPQEIDAFLAGNYNGGYVLKDIEKYNIENVAMQFLQLTGNQ